MTAADGMCRPAHFNVFVFVGGRFAGTLSPQLMTSRLDASIGALRIAAEFARYRVGWGDGTDRASHDADVSIALPKIPYGGFSPVRLQGQPIKCDLPTRAARNRERRLPACPRRATRLSAPFARFHLGPMPGSES